jgi:hypothetical protein
MRAAQKRRTHLRHHDNILKRLLIHASAFNLGLAMRKMTGYGTPRGLQHRLNAFLAGLRLLFAASALLALDMPAAMREHSANRRDCSCS